MILEIKLVLWFEPYHAYHKCKYVWHLGVKRLLALNKGLFGNISLFCFVFCFLFHVSRSLFLLIF